MQGQARTEKRGGCSNASKGRYGFRNVLAFILAPFLHLLFEVFGTASASNFCCEHVTFCITLGSLLVPFWRHGVLRDAFGPMDAKTEACVGPVGSILEPLGGLWAALGHPLSSLWGALASICDPLLPKIAPK